MYAGAGLSGTRVMPGGLARVATDAAVDVVSTQRGGGSKDIWVLPDSSEEVVPISTARSLQARVRHDDIPSRLVENLYWFGRYTVGCEGKGRLLRGPLFARSWGGGGEPAGGVCR